MTVSTQKIHYSLKGPKIDFSRQTDMETVQYLLNFFGFSIIDGMKINKETSLQRNFVELAENLMKEMVNPFDKDLLKLAIKEWKLKIASESKL